MIVISSSYGNDSKALIQWAHEVALEDVHVVYCDTGWAAPGWNDHVSQCEDWVKTLGFTPLRVKSLGMEELVRTKKGFPSNQYQFCTAHLKGLPFLQWIDEADPDRKAMVVIGKRRAESRARANTPLYTLDSEPHGGRTLMCPLYRHTDADRDALVSRTPFDLVPHRSQECSPCVNANRGDFKLLTTSQIERVCSLEVEIGKSMFRPKRFGALGIHGVIAWAIHGRRRMELEPDEIIEGSGCDGDYGCGL